MERLATLCASFLFAFALMAQDAVRDRIIAAMETGNSRELAAHFIPNIDLTVKETGDVYSKAQAEQILRRFFNDHPPVGMVVEHSKPSKLGDIYYICILRTRNGFFRVTFFLKKYDDEFKIRQLRIENSRSDF
jgi:hypothetical protein